MPDQSGFRGCADPLALYCPDGHAVLPSNLSVAKGMFYCPKFAKHERHKAYFAPRELHTVCCNCGFWTPPEGDCTDADGCNVCAECAMSQIGASHAA